MTVTAIALAVLCLIALGALVVMPALELRAVRRSHVAEIKLIELLTEGERERLLERVKYLEFQLASHVAHLLKLPPPVPPIDNGPKPEPLPEVMRAFLDAIDDEEARMEFEGEFRARLQLGADPHKVVSEAMSA